MERLFSLLVSLIGLLSYILDPQHPLPPQNSSLFMDLVEFVLMTRIGIKAIAARSLKLILF